MSSSPVQFLWSYALKSDRNVLQNYRTRPRAEAIRIPSLRQNVLNSLEMKRPCRKLRGYYHYFSPEFIHLEGVLLEMMQGSKITIFDESQKKDDDDTNEQHGVDPFPLPTSVFITYLLHIY